MLRTVTNSNVDRGKNAKLVLQSSKYSKFQFKLQNYHYKFDFQKNQFVFSQSKKRRTTLQKGRVREILTSNFRFIFVYQNTSLYFWTFCNLLYLNLHSILKKRIQISRCALFNVMIFIYASNHIL